jgi:poly(beta-D-mannuronate) lyase
MRAGGPEDPERRRLLAGAAAFFCAEGAGLGSAFAGVPGSELRNPFDVEALRRRKGRAFPVALSCLPAEPPPRDLVVPMFHLDPTHHSKVDPERYAAREEAVAPLSRLSRAVTEATDRWAGSFPAESSAAACAVASLAAAARSDAMLGKVDIQGGFERKWTLCGLAVAHLKLLAAPEYDAARRAEVVAWFRRALPEVRRPYDKPPAGPIPMQRNNHMTWAGTTVMALAIAVADRKAWDWGLERMRMTLAQVDRDGFLPLELARRSKALHYHIFTMAPLALAAEFAAAQGLDPFGPAEGPYRRLARRTLQGHTDPSAFAARTGAVQDFVGGRANVGWLEIHASRFDTEEALSLLKGRRPQRHPWLGGDLTLWYG